MKNFSSDAALLEVYMKNGMQSRALYVGSLLDLINSPLTPAYLDLAKKNIGLTEEESRAALQIALISGLMILTEDIFTICYSKLKDESYYKFLDVSDKEHDLGGILKDFRFSINDLTDKDLRKILDYVEPSDYDFDSQEEQKTIEHIMKKDTDLTKSFLQKIGVFRDGHIGVFRRFKHAGIPMQLSEKIPSGHKEYQNFDFVSKVFTGKEKPDSELTTIPYSKEIISTYENLFADLIHFIPPLVHMAIESFRRDSKLIPSPEVKTFSDSYTEEETIALKPIFEKFNKKHPLDDVNPFKFSPKTIHPDWYTQINSYSERIFNVKY